MKDSIIAVRSIQFDSNNDLLLVQVGFGVTQNDGERACGSLEVRLVGLGQSLDQIKSRAVLQARLILEGVLFGQSEKTENSKDLPITDPLTGLLNRRYLEERFAEELERSKRYQYPLSFAMIDIDSFKSFNDTFGHQAGDEVLRATAHCIRGSLRNFDVAARYGGEEFILVLPETDLTSAVALAERLRKQIEEHFSGTQSHRPLTVSIGIAGLNQKLHSKHQIIRAADQALYAAKKRGKNCVVVYNAELDPDLA